MRKKLLTSILVCAAILSHSARAEVPLPAGLPTIGPPTDFGPDYLVDPRPYVARVGLSPDGREIVLDNGLVRRVWRIAPNGACVAFDNLSTRQSMLRSVRPEARVTISGRQFDVGGLTGQPNHAFLTEQWLDEMQADPRAMRLVAVSTGKPVERFGWKRRRHADPMAAWPPKGVSLRMDYGLPNPAFDESPRSDFARKASWRDDFTKLSDAWRVHASSAHARTSFENEGKPGELYGPASAHCFAERRVPEDTALIEAVFSPGTDTATSWGPGLTWVFERATVKLNLRPGDRGEHGLVELRVNGRERLVSPKAFTARDGGLELSKRYRLRMRSEGVDVIAEAAAVTERDPVYTRLFEFRREREWGRSVAMRVGKMDRRGAASDDTEHLGDLVRSRVESAAAYGPLDPRAVQRARAAAERVDRVKSPIVVSVHYELYDGVPVTSKWITVRNRGKESITVDRFVGEELAVVETTNWVESREGVDVPPPDQLHVETDFAFGGFNHANANGHAVHWRTDPLYTTQVNYLKRTPCLLVVEPTHGPGQVVPPGGTFEGFRVFELAHDDGNRERRGLALRRMYRTVAPWVTENPLTHHLLANDPDRVRTAVDEAAEVGFEAVLLSFGSGFNMENRDPAFLARWKEVADHAEAKGIELGCYSLFSSRNVGREHMIVSPPGTRPTHGRCPAVTSTWGRQWLETIRDFYDRTGFDQFENDGPYPGDVDVTPRPPWQRGIEDSRWAQWRLTAGLYRDLRERGVYVNAPDYYFLNGSNKCGMGYREVNWSLPRAHQVIHTRQNVYDGTWEKTPSMGWMFVPLTQYHGGGTAATIEPLDRHRDHYRRMLESNLGMGVQAHYRGPRLFDTPATRDVVLSAVSWFKEYRTILEGDIVHGRRADGRDVDWVLHVAPDNDPPGMLCIYNPLDREVTRTLRVDLRYTGIRETAVLVNEDDPPRRVVCRNGAIEVTVTVPTGGMTWYAIRELGEQPR